MKLIALLVVWVAGCAATGTDMNAARYSWAGAYFDDVVLAWGAPLRSTPLADGRFAYTWISDGQVPGGRFFPSIGIFGGSGGVGVGVGVGAGAGGGDFARCERTLVFRDARVVEQAWHGPAAYCSTFQRR